jgi:threonine/homoserine/homoserine lactone efflux protein
VGIVFAAFPWAALAVKIAGAAYLIWFGGNLILKAGSGSAQSNTATAAVNVQEAAGLRQAFVQGFLTNIVNPKSMAFFAAVFASATPAHVSWPTFAAMLGVVGVVASSWYSMVAILMSHARIASHYRAGKLWIDRLCGGVIVALGIRQLAR